MYDCFMVRTQINLRDSQYHFLVDKARKEGESVSEIVRKIIDSALRIKKDESNAWILLDMAKHAGRSGEKNLSTTYKKILYGERRK